MNRSALQLSSVGAAGVLRDLWDKFGSVEFQCLTTYEGRVVEGLLDAVDELAQQIDAEARK